MFNILSCGFKTFEIFKLNYIQQQLKLSALETLTK